MRILEVSTPYRAEEWQRWVMMTAICHGWWMMLLLVLELCHADSCISAPFLMVFGRTKAVLLHYLIGDSSNTITTLLLVFYTRWHVKK